MRSKLYRLNLSMSGGALYCTEGSLYNEYEAVQVELVHVLEGPCTVQRSPCTMRSKLYRQNLSMSWRGLVLYRGVPVQ